MKGSRVKVKHIMPKGAGDLKDMFKEMFSVSKANIHVYLDKIFKMADQMDNVLKAIKSVRQSLYKDASAILHTPTDQLYFDQTKGLKQLITEELQSRRCSVVDKTTIQVYSVLKDTLDFGQIQRISDFYQGSGDRNSGQDGESIAYKIINDSANLARVFKDIDGATSLSSYFSNKINQNENMMRFLDMDLETRIRDVLLDESERDSQETMLKIIKISIQIILKEINKYYAIIKIPEFDVSQLREVVQQAIAEFKKTVHGCDEAFDKLLKSLDTFNGNFDNYYEQFQLNNREPATLLLSFIDDVQQQYANSDTGEYRVLIRQFKKIQQEFGKRLASNLQNPMLKELYSQLEKQINQASTLLGVSEDT